MNRSNIGQPSQRIEYLYVHPNYQKKSSSISWPLNSIFQPKFSELTRIWLQFQNYIYLLSEINQISNTLTNLTERCLSFDDLAYRLLGECQIHTDIDRLNKTKGKRLLMSVENACEVVTYTPGMKVWFGRKWLYSGITKPRTFWLIAGWTVEVLRVAFGRGKWGADARQYRHGSVSTPEGLLCVQYSWGSRLFRWRSWQVSWQLQLRAIAIHG